MEIEFAINRKFDWFGHIPLLSQVVGVCIVQIEKVKPCCDVGTPRCHTLERYIENCALLVILGTLLRESLVQTRNFILSAIRVFEHPIAEFDIVDIVISRVLEIFGGYIEKIENDLINGTIVDIIVELVLPLLRVLYRPCAIRHKCLQHHYYTANAVDVGSDRYLENIPSRRVP